MKRDEVLEIKKWKLITVDYKSIVNRISNFKELVSSAKYQDERQIIEGNIESITMYPD